MKKRIYRRMPVNEFQSHSISLADLGGKLVFAIDIAKVDMVATLVAADKQVLATLRWKAPAGDPALIAILRHFRTAEISVEVAMEPSGTYGDVLRHQIVSDGFPVFLINGKRTSDAQEVYDGVPSLHDAKAAGTIAKLHLDGLSRRFSPLSPDRQQLRAAILPLHLQERRPARGTLRDSTWPNSRCS